MVVVFRPAKTHGRFEMLKKTPAILLTALLNETAQCEEFELNAERVVCADQFNP